VLGFFNLKAGKPNKNKIKCDDIVKKNVYRRKHRQIATHTNATAIFWDAKCTKDLFA
jgi:hypothetical protein